jgi:hypothetical protein
VSCVLATAVAQFWSGPYQLTSDSFADENPSACREWIDGTATRLVWQTNRNGDWDVYSRLCRFQNGNGWEEEIPVCTDSGDDITPTVAARFDVMRGWVYWCVWERHESPVAGRIMAASASASDTVWSAPVEVGRCLHTSGDSARPFVMTIEHESSDTLWAAWTEHDTDGWSVRYSRCVNNAWSQPGVAVARSAPIRHARIGRGKTAAGSPCPLLVWEESGDIFYSEYASGAWTVPLEVAHSASLDRNPEVVSYSWFPLGPWITWESCRDGDTAIYGTAADTFSIARRWCDSSGAGGNFTPAGTPAEYTTDLAEPLAAVWVSNRTGNPDIYSNLMLWPYGDCYVDQNPATDINPTLTTLGATMHWCVWQSDRTGNWDIWGSYVYATGAEESAKPQAPSFKPAPTIARDVLVLQNGSSASSSTSRLLDISGRKVLTLAPGANDVSRLSPGVYFVREEPQAPSLKPQAIGKVIITK